LDFVLLLKYNNREGYMITKLFKLVLAYITGYGAGWLLFVLAMGVIGTLAACTTAL
tara:strand:+ start:2703 stop:2870 length:168 start_codon:yes stop_codon:yes gene_type:complete